MAAVYFPPTPASFGRICAKFLSDRKGVRVNDADGFIFFVNQYLTLGQRKELLDLGGSLDQIFHLERIRSTLDSPRGYGLRLEYLKRTMSPEEQIAFFSTLRQDVVQTLLANERRADSLWAENVTAVSRLNFSALQLLHRAMTIDDELQGPIGGQLRAVQVWVVDECGDPIYMPPPPEDVPSRLADLFGWWNDAYVVAIAADPESVIHTLARLHYGILSIHPFVDYNDRLARLITDQAARELLGTGVAVGLITDRPTYYRALDAANHGNLDDLTDLIRVALE